MKIAISGLGITGAAAACFLAADGHHVTVFEQADRSEASGAGILYWAQFKMPAFWIASQYAPQGQYILPA